MDIETESSYTGEILVNNNPITGHVMAYSTKNSPDAYTELEKSIFEALKSYSNVHRGTGHYSIATTALYDEARNIILDYLGLNKKKYTAVFCTPYGLSLFQKKLKRGTSRILTSKELGLNIGVSVIAVKRKCLPRGIPFHTGGDVIKLVSPNSVVWAQPPFRYEAGTPSIINIIAFARALQIVQKKGDTCFFYHEENSLSIHDILHYDEFEKLQGQELLYAIRNSIIGNKQSVPVDNGEKQYINLDNGASTPAPLPVWKTYIMALKYGEPLKEKIISEVSNTLLEFLGASRKSYDILFTRNTSESVNIASSMLHNEFQNSTDTVIVNTVMEHHSNELPWRYMPNSSLVRLPVDKNGFIDLEELELLLRNYNRNHLYGKKRVRLVAVTGASNVLGTIQDIYAISKLVHAYGARILVDAAQLAAHRKIETDRGNIDYLAFSGHKMYAPFGCGALVIKKDLLCLGKNELKLIKESGEENIAGIAAAGKAARLLMRIGMDLIEEEEKSLICGTLSGLKEIPGIEIFGMHSSDSKKICSKGGVITFSINHVPHNLVARELAEEGGIGVRSGCFCAHIITKKMMNIIPFRSFAADAGAVLFPEFTRTVVPGLVRASIGIENGEDDIERFIETVTKIAAAPGLKQNDSLVQHITGPLFLRTQLYRKKLMSMYNKNWTKCMDEKRGLMKYITFNSYGPPDVLRYEEKEIPVPKHGEILIKTGASTVTAGDVRMRKADPFLVRLYSGIFKPRRVRVLGFELSGTVEDTGDGVTKFKKGDEVYAFTGFNFGAYAEYICLPEAGTVKTGMCAHKPQNMDFLEAAGAPVGGITALAFLRKADIEKRKKVMIYGASGSVGTFAVQLAKYFGAEVTGACSGKNTEMVTSLGADFVVDYTSDNFADLSKRFDFVFDAVGKASKSTCRKLLAPKGIFLSVMGSGKNDHRDLELLKEIIEQGKVRTVIDRVYPFDKIVEAHRYVEKGHKRGNVIIQIT